MITPQGSGRQPDLTRTTFAVLAIGLLIGATLWIVRPFLGPAIWATMIVVATWPVMLRLQGWLWNKRVLAVAVMTLVLLLLFVVPLVLAIGTIAGNADQIAEWARAATEWRPPDSAPAWARSLPVVGGMIDKLWEQATALGLRELLSKLTPYAGNMTKWFVAEVGSIGFLIVQFLVTVVIAAVMYTMGEEFGDFARRFARRLGGERGADAVKLAGDAIRGVALGVGVTAVVQSVLGGVGLAIAGVPFFGLLTALMFMLCIAQVGPFPVLLPAAAWVLYSGSTGWGIFLIVWALIVGTLDNFLRPMLIRMGADLSLLLIFAGVIGGLLAFGLVGLFVGPVVLAVSLTLLESWVADAEPAAAAPSPPGDEV